MADTLIAQSEIYVNAPVENVWRAITNPELISKYLYGTKVTTDWKVGSPITYEGEYNGTSYKDKGVIKALEPNKVFASTYWSSMGGKEDKPENYNLVTYILFATPNGTHVIITQDNVASEKEKEHSEGNWQSVLAELQKVAEAL